MAGAMALLLGLASTGWAERVRAPRTTYRVQGPRGAERARLSAPQLQAQHKAIKTFTGRINKALGGQPIGLFDNVRIEPRTSRFSRALTLDHMTRTLVIRPRVDRRGGLKVLDAKAIESLWNKGEAVGLSWLARAIPFGKAKKAKQAWKVLNPIGSLRLGLRNLVSGSASRLSATLDKLDVKKTPLSTLRRKLGELVATNTLTGVQTAKGVDINTTAQARLGKANRKQLGAFVASWSGFLKSGGNRVAMADAAFAPSSQKRAWKQEQSALFVISQVQNNKQISVDAQLGLSSKRGLFARYLPKVGGEAGKGKPVTMRQRALVAISQVQLADDVSVRAQLLLSGGKLGAALPTAGLKQALGALGN
jgi:hypothetical protein